MAWSGRDPGQLQLLSDLAGCSPWIHRDSLLQGSGTVAVVGPRGGCPGLSGDNAVTWGQQNQGGGADAASHGLAGW